MTRTEAVRPSGAVQARVAPRSLPTVGASPDWSRSRRIRPEWGASMASRTLKATPRLVAVSVDMKERLPV